VKILFTPILAPMPRGILATVTAKITKQITADQLRGEYEKFYGVGFVHILDPGAMPATSSVLGTNNAHIQIAVDSHTQRLVVSCAIDNLGKGAAGQAIHNANLMAGFPADTGLTSMGVR
jgi:N-acetyl-gamma-glutamyl-phosphate reductase